MRRKSIGATSQAFHEPMSTGAFLEFLTGMQGWLVGQVFRGLGPGPAAESEDRNPASHGTVQLPLRKPSNAPLWARSPGGLGPGPPGLGARPTRGLGPFPHKNHPNLSNYDFFANLLVGAWRRRGCRLKWLLRRWGPGGKRSRDTPPPHPPPRFRGFSPSPPSATIQHAPQGRRITLKPLTRNPKL